MPGIEILPVQDSLVVEDPVAEVADLKPPFVELGLVLFRGWRVRKRAFGKIRPDPGAGVGVVEKARPEAEGEFRYDASRRKRLPTLSQGVFGRRDLVLLPKGEPGSCGVIPAIRATAGGEFPMDRVTQRDLGELQSRVEGLAERQVQKIAGQGDRGSRTILAIGVDPLRVKDAFDGLEECQIHAPVNRFAG